MQRGGELWANRQRARACRRRAMPTCSSPTAARSTARSAPPAGARARLQNEAGRKPDRVPRSQGRSTTEIGAELASLKGAPLQHSRPYVGHPHGPVRRARARCRHDLPFAGELIQVRPEERAWEGAAERLLHGFALSLLVPDGHYAAVASWVDATHLGSRLVYYRVHSRPGTVRARRDAQGDGQQARDQGPNRRSTTGCSASSAERFDHICCASLDEFRREGEGRSRVPARSRRGGKRHEKDDRSRIDDRRNFVLGWSNEAKIAALREGSRRTRGPHAGARRARSRGLDGERSALAGASSACFSSSPRSPASTSSTGAAGRAEIDRLDAERRQLEEGSDVLETLKAQLDGVEQAIAEVEGQLDAASREHSRLRGDGAPRPSGSWAPPKPTSPRSPRTRRAAVFPKLEAARSEALGEHRLTVEVLRRLRAKMRDWLQGRIDAESQQAHAAARQDRRAMRDYRNLARWRRARSTPAWRRPASSARCWPRSNATTCRGSRRASRSCSTRTRSARSPASSPSSSASAETIRERIDDHQPVAARDRLQPRPLHRAGGATDARPGGPRLPAGPARLHRGRARRARTTRPYSEAKFLAGQAHHRALPRPRGHRPSSTGAGPRKVTDVRNWFVFSASERWREDDSEHEHYTDSGGKSGGQKEKLAYTVLAASLAYQFGLELGRDRARARSVSWSSTRRSDAARTSRPDTALELFKRLDLQLLDRHAAAEDPHHRAATSPASASCTTRTGAARRLRNLTIEEYRAERLRRAG